MNEKIDLSPDDLADILEMSSKIENFIDKTVKESGKNITMSVLMTASINSLLKRCSTLEDVIFHRNFFIRVLDNSIRGIRLKDSDDPTS